MLNVLIVDDDPVFSKVLQARLKKWGYAAQCCTSGSEARLSILESKPDLVLMDVMLGDEDGRDICRSLKSGASTSRIPMILISSAKIEDRDVIYGLKGGADEYLLKSHSPDMMLARIEAVLRRYRAPEEISEALSIFGIELNVAERNVTINKKRVHLTRKEFDLLTILLRSPGRLQSQAYLLDTVWGVERDNDRNTLQVHVSRLRRKLGKTFSSRLENVLGSGYRIRA